MTVRKTLALALLITAFPGSLAMAIDTRSHSGTSCNADVPPTYDAVGASNPSAAPKIVVCPVQRDVGTTGKDRHGDQATICRVNYVGWFKTEVEDWSSASNIECSLKIVYWRPGAAFPTTESLPLNNSVSTGRQVLSTYVDRNLTHADVMTMECSLPGATAQGRSGILKYSVTESPTTCQT